MLKDLLEISKIKYIINILKNKWLKNMIKYINKNKHNVNNLNKNKK